MNSNNHDKNEEKYVPSSVVPGCVSLPLPGPFSNLSAIFEVETRSLEVKFNRPEKYPNQKEDKECRTHIQILDLVNVKTKSKIG